MKRKLIFELAQACNRFPDQRVMQVVFNALDAKGKARMADGTPRDVFYVSDDDLEAALRDL
jgi:hypothetical protein